MRALSAVLFAFMVVWASDNTDGAGFPNQLPRHCAFRVKPAGFESRLPGGTSIVSIRLSVFDADIVVSSASAAQKPLRAGGLFCEQNCKSYSVEPFQPPTVTLYTF